MNDEGQKYSKEQHLGELLRILRHKFFGIIRVKLQEDKAYILQSVDHSKCVGQEFSWTEYLQNYSRFVGRKPLEILMPEQLLQKYRLGQTDFSTEIYYVVKRERQWLTIEVYMREEQGEIYATVIIKSSTREHLQRSIIEQLVFDKCDYFVSLDAKTDSFEVFGGDVDGLPVSDKKYENYSSEVLKYVKNYVVPDERIRVMRQMGLNYVQEQLEKKEAHIFNFGIMEPNHGYRRKQLEYRYYDADAQVLLLSRTDITDLYMEAQEQQTELMTALNKARTDSLTGLLNHHRMIEEVSASLETEETESALMFIDMDDFKNVNDSLGHIAGDKLLCDTARILREGVRADDLVGRVGGDEFMVFLRNIGSMEKAQECAERLCKGIRRLSVEFGFPISCSIGIALSPKDGRNYTMLTESADKRVYHAKSRGKNQISVD